MEKSNNIKGLVLSGGGNRGSFQVGVLKKLLEIDKGEWYKVFCGVSVGSINAAFLSQYTTRNSIQGLVNIWENLTDDQVKKRWFPFGRLHALWQKGMYNTSPLRQTIEKNFNQQKLLNTGNKLRIGAVNLSTLEYKLFKENEPNIIDAIMASSAFPGMLPATKVGEDYYIDGGVRTVTPLRAAIDIPEVDEIDIILADKRIEKYDKVHPKNAIDVACASLQAAMTEIIANDIRLCELYNNLIHVKAPGFRGRKYVKMRIFEPKQQEMPGNPLDFDHEPIMEMIEMGYKTASKQLEK